MTEEEVRTFLKAGRGKLQMEEELEREMAELDSEVPTIRAIDYEKTKVSGGELSDLSDAVIRKELAMARLYRKMATIQADVFEWKEKALEMILTCDDSVKRSILMERFISCDNWGTIQNHHNYGESNPYKLCQKAISEIARKYRG